MVQNVSFNRLKNMVKCVLFLLARDLYCEPNSTFISEGNVGKGISLEARCKLKETSTFLDVYDSKTVPNSASDPTA